MEKKAQDKLVKYLKSKKCYVLRLRSGPNYPAGCPDIIALYEGFWAAFEVKASPTAKFQPLQKETIEKFEQWSFARVVYPENVDEVIGELDAIL